MNEDFEVVEVIHSKRGTLVRIEVVEREMPPDFEEDEEGEPIYESPEHGRAWDDFCAWAGGEAGIALESRTMGFYGLKGDDWKPGDRVKMTLERAAPDA